MKFVRFIVVAILFPAFFLVALSSPAQAYPGEDPNSPVVVTDSQLVPATAEASVYGCKTVFRWNVYFEEQTEIVGEIYVNDAGEYWPADAVPWNRGFWFVPNPNSPATIPDGYELLDSYVIQEARESATIYYQYTNAFECLGYTPRVTVVDRCGWRRDAVHIWHDPRIESVMIWQASKVRWYVGILLKPGFVTKKTGTRFASYTYLAVEKSPC